ncbi:neuropeptide-like 1 isoform X2 [Zootermopsis nevadensis]|uniref:Neuropeptide-like 1 n=1 Tax=Zootermopsis nevadensis TaxID=136037 RepID=A0A067RCU1_ZOONE|nr:neuropeptide-like 1 isoform X2 [Zootermopsis nevadensis]KDR21651.1 hypothetical protein L798_01887 [Zootermopsis nevadensis]
MWLSAPSRALLVGIAVLFIVFSPQARSEETPTGQHVVDKRHVGALARTGQLPFQGKRSYAALARNGDLPFNVREQWIKKTHPMMTGSGGRYLEDLLLPPTTKRYVGSLAKSGGLPFSRVEGKRTDEGSEASEVDNLLQSVLETEDLWRLQLTALKQELLREQEEELENQLQEDDTDEEKRNVGSLARSGNMPFKNGKRSVEALARAGYLPVPKQPQESADYPHDSNEDSEELVGKRSIAVLAKNGQLSAHGLKDLFHEGGNRGDDAYLEYLHQKREGDEAGEGLDELIQELYQEGQETGKRNIGSLARGYNFPYHGRKRTLGSIVRSGGFRFGGATKKVGDDDKRSVTSLIRHRINPFQEGKRYIGSVMRNQGSHFGLSKKDDSELEDDAKRNIGAMVRNWYLPEHLKYGKRPNDEDDEVEDDTAKRSVPTGLKDEKQVQATATAKQKRTKRQAFLVPATSSDEYPMPVMQNSDLFDYEDLAELLSGGAAPEKRFLGRIPQMGTKRPRTTPFPGRKSPHARNI